MAEIVPVPVIATALEAIASAFQPLTDKNTVVSVQRALLSKGYVDGGPADGVLGQQTQDQILAFRARNDLPLTPVIDAALIDALHTAENKEVPIEQLTATKEFLAPTVKVIALGEQVQKVAWWTKLWAVLTGIPSAVFALALAIVNNLDEASAAIAPLKNLFSDLQIPGWLWMMGLVLIAGIFGYQAIRIDSLSKQIEASAVDGYQRGTVKDDVPPNQLPKEAA